MRVLLRCVAVLILLLTLSATARAQDAAIRACLLLRSPAQCGVGTATPFAASGDMQTLRVLRPDPMLRAESESKEPDKFTPLRGDAGGETSLEKHRQIFNLPFSWDPFRKLSIAGDVPLIAQALTDSTIYSLGDVDMNATFRANEGPLTVRALGTAKLPTGDKSRGAGSGELDGYGLFEGWFKLGKFSSALSAAYRHNGGAGTDDLFQGSVAAQVDVPITPLVDLSCQVRGFGHRIIGDAPRTTFHVGVGVEPHLIGIAVGYVYALIPVRDDSTLESGPMLSAGVMLPFGPAPKSPLVDTTPPPAEDMLPAATPTQTPTQTPAPPEPARQPAPTTPPEPARQPAPTTPPEPSPTPEQ